MNGIPWETPEYKMAARMADQERRLRSIEGRGTRGVLTAQLYQGSAQSISNGAWNYPLFDFASGWTWSAGLSIYDDPGGKDRVLLAFPEATGLVHARVWCGWASNATGFRQLALHWYTGSEWDLVMDSRMAVNGAPTYQSGQGTFPIPGPGGYWLGCSVYQTSTAALNLDYVRLEVWVDK